MERVFLKGSRNSITIFSTRENKQYLNNEEKIILHIFLLMNMYQDQNKISSIAFHGSSSHSTFHLNPLMEASLFLHDPNRFLVLPQHTNQNIFI